MCHGRIRRHPEELRQTAIKQFRSCHNVAHLAREIGIHEKGGVHGWSCPTPFVR
jgi:transposase-like protein